VTEPLLHIERRDDGLATITLAHGRVNALCVALLGQLGAAAAELADARVVVITGGPKIFAAGADITEFAADASPESFRLADPARLREIGAAFRDALDAVAAMTCPTIASVAGFALGGGCELALACDIRIASDRARFGQPEIMLGIIPGGGGTQRLARLLGPSRAKDLIVTGRQVEAAEALAIGLVNRVVPHDDLAVETDALATALCAGPSHALALAKRAIDGGLLGTLAAGLDLEGELFMDSFGTSDAPIGVSSFLANGPGHADFS